jgi:hypothetical protein
MGGAYVAVADDPNALLWNPAGLANVTAPEAGALYAAYVAQTSFQVLGYAQPMGPLGTIAGAASFLDYGSLTRTVASSDGLYAGTAGKVWAADGFATGGWGRRVANWGSAAGVLDAGAAVKVVVQHPGPTSRLAVGGSAGVLWHPPVSGLTAGLVADNVGAMTDGSGLMPATWRAGAGWDVPVSGSLRTLWAADAAVTADAGTQGHAGLECTVAELVALRVGWSAGAAAGGITFGLGAFVPSAWTGAPVTIRIDYAGAAMDELGLTHRVQVLVRWGGGAGGKPHGFKIIKDSGQRMLTWEGGRGPFEVSARRPGTDEAVALTDRPSADRRCAIAALTPGVWSVTVRGQAPDGTAWRRDDQTSVKVTIPAPVAAPKPAAPAAAAPLRAATGLKLERADGRSWLVWSGAAPAWIVFVQSEADPAPVPVTPSPVTALRVPLPSLRAGRYAFTVRAVDPADPSRAPADSASFRIVVTPRAK